jgi:hypothetical protein
MKYALLLPFISLLASCVTNVQSLKNDVNVPLQEGYGYLLLGVTANRTLEFVQLKGEQWLNLTAYDLRPGSHYFLLNVKAGRYSIRRMQLDAFNRIGLNDESWEFEVYPRQISYVGTLELNTRGFWTAVELVNRSSEALEFMETSFPNILSAWKIAFGGVGQDDFYNMLEKNELETSQ